MAIFYLVLKIETAQKIARHAVSIRVTPSSSMTAPSESSSSASTAAATAGPETYPPFRVQFGPGALGLRLRLLPDGTIGVIGFTEDASAEVREALATGDRICAIGKNPVPPFTALEKAALYITSSVRPVDIIFFRPHVPNMDQKAPLTGGITRAAPTAAADEEKPAKRARVEESAAAPVAAAGDAAATVAAAPAAAAETSEAPVTADADAAASAEKKKE